MMMGEKTDPAAFIHVVVMSAPAVVVALTCSGSKLECLHRKHFSFIKEPLANH